ncbi:hypothetical protein HQQ81_10520 [Microbacteriaceae bacterium VKM Ac-2854]|nr:hypothetical protein [Microbacteriaceae bacterium VKM Ac-2854]
MTTMVKLIINGISGLVLGAAVLFLGLVASSAFAFATSSQALIPGVFKAWFVTENDLPAMNFEPNFFGMLMVILLVAAAYMYIAHQIGRRIAARRRFNV